jgi:hypothetical protein
MPNEWYVQHGGKEHGPLTSVNLKKLAEDGKIAPTTSVRLGADGAWVPAGRVKGLFPAATAAAPTVKPAPAAAVLKTAPLAAPPIAPPPAPLKADPLARAPLPKAAPLTAKPKAKSTDDGGSMTPKILGAVALILGILALATCWLPVLGGVLGWIGVVVGSLGALLGIVALVAAAMGKGSGLAVSIAGSSSSLVGLLLWVVLGVHFGFFKGPEPPKPPPVIAQAPVIPPPKEPEPEPPKEPEPPPEPQWFDASQPIEQGDIRARVVSVGIEKVRVEDMDLSTLKAAKPKPLLVVRVSVENIAANKIIEFTGWQGGADLVGGGVGELLGNSELGKAVQSATAKAVLKDNFGNPYKHMPAVQIMGAGLKIEAVQSIRPNETGKAEMVYSPLPLETIEYLRLELSPQAYGGSEPLRFQIPRSMIAGMATPQPPTTGSP